MPILNPEILSWARETAGLSLAQAADTIGIKESRGSSGAERLAALEAGNDDVSRSQLLRMAKVYRRSLLVFYLDHPPQKGDRGQDFRTVPGSEPPLYSPTLDALIRDIRGRQGIIKSLRQDGEAEKLPFVGSTNMSLASDSLAERIVHNIGFSLEEFRGQSSIENAFTYLRSKIEGSGIFVLLVGNLGSHHTNISVETFRGYAIADEIAPVVVINDQDAKSAWAFTALHEVAHLWLGTTGISGVRPEVGIERYCNDVAGEILLPSSERDNLSRLRFNAVAELIDDISAFARDRKISRAMVAYRLLQLDLIGPSTWNELTDHFRKAWLASQERGVIDADRRGGGGPNYYAVKRHRLGKALLGLVTRSLGDGLITPTKAGLLLGVKPRNVDPLVFGDRRVRGGR
jgi:Zn-dependent peptidase ImmA (M78 family)/transcriptional regulator with XRE-family HTH domain